jgi:hypothetical protein
MAHKKVDPVSTNRFDRSGFPAESGLSFCSPERAPLTGTIFIVAMIGSLLLMALNEVVRYRRAARTPDGLPYPRRRLIRRLGIALLFILILTAMALWPDSGALRTRLALSALVLCLLALAMVLLLRDLLDTSRSVVALTEEWNARHAAEWSDLMRRQRQSKDSDNGGDSGDRTTED